jgi:alkaline phosphatase D
MRMNRLIPLAMTISLLAVAPSAHAARGFSYGVAAGEVTSGSAVLWAKANKAAAYTLDVARNKRFNKELHSKVARAKQSHDNTVQTRIGGLKAGKKYFYRFVGRGSRSEVGAFVTAPKPSANATVEFGWTGDTDFNPAPGKRKPYWSDGGVYGRMAAERNQFNINLGDTIYTDSEVPGRVKPLALTVPAKWAKYRINLANRNLHAVRRSGGFYSQWDDHEFVNDFSPAQNTFTPSFSDPITLNGRTLYQRGMRAFRDYAPVTWTKARGLYRRFRWGRNLELFFLDERSFRSANADAGGVCDNPQTGKPDFAPTAPQSTRDVFALLYPPFSAPVSQACLDTIRDPNRTYLGRSQLERFLRDVKRSTARFKVIVNELAIQQYYINAYDRWEGFEADRQRVLHGLQGVKNVIFLSTDVHATLINDARFQTLEPGGPQPSGITDITVGPAATMQFAREIDEGTGRSGNGAAADSTFFTPPPPDGVGMKCSIVDQFSYGQVRVTANQLTVVPKNAGGQPQSDNGQPCQVTLNYVP